MSYVDRNTEKWLQSTASSGPELTLMRLQQVPQSLPAALYHCVDLLQQWTGASRVLYKGLPGKRKYPPQEIPFNAEAIAQYVSENLSMSNSEDWHAQVFKLQDTGKVVSNYALVWSHNQYLRNPGLDRIKITLSLNTDYAADRYSNGEFSDLLGRIAAGASATQAFVYEQRTASLYVGPRWFQEVLNEYPPEEHDRIPPLLLPEDLELHLPQVLYETETNFRMAPQAVWWINYWNQTIVENVGRDRILAAPWAAIHEMPDGALLLEATRERLDVARRDHCQRLREICEAIDLIGVQERFRLK